jgi:hypothetical protein
LVRGEPEVALDVFEGSRLAALTAAEDRLPGETVGAVDESESGEDGLGFAKLGVDAGRAATVLGVVHAGEIVEEERGGVEVFEGEAELGGVDRGEAVGGEHLGDDLGAD